MAEPEDICSQDDCPDPGCWGVRARIFTTEGRRLPGEIVFTNIRLCDKHRDALTARDIITDENWPTISGKFSTIHGARADRARTQLFFEPVPVGVFAA